MVKNKNVAFKKWFLHLLLTVYLSFYFGNIKFVSHHLGALRRIRQIDPQVIGSDPDPERLAGILAAPFEQLFSGDVRYAGGKGANLGEIRHLKGVNSKDGFVVLTGSYRKFLDANSDLEIPGLPGKGLEEIIRKQLENLDYHDKVALERASSNIARAFQQAKIPQEVIEEVKRQYSNLVARTGGKDLRLAVRSSATAEDIEEKAFAGAMETFLFVPATDLADRIKDCWASLFGVRAIEQRSQLIEQEASKPEPKVKRDFLWKVSIAVVVMEIVNSRFAGTGFSIDHVTGQRDVYTIDISRGLGELVVQGKITPDAYRVIKNPEGEFVVLEKNFGTKEEMMIFKEDITKYPGARIIKEGRYTYIIETPSPLKGKWAITEEQAIKIVQMFELVHNHYNQKNKRPENQPLGIDMEFAIDDSGEPILLQARPETRHSPHAKEKVIRRGYSVPEDVVEGMKPVASGIKGESAVFGVFYSIPSDLPPAELARREQEMPEGAILVTDYTGPDMVPLMKKSGGIIARQGGATSHAMIVGRELGKPVVVGTGDFSVKDGEIGLLDANNGKLYVWTKDRGTATENLIARYLKDETKEYYVKDVPQRHEEIAKGKRLDVLPNLTRTKIGINVANPNEAGAMAALAEYDDMYGVSLFRAEFALADIGIHPKALFEYDLFKQGKATPEMVARITKIKEKIEKRLAGYLDSPTPGFDFYKEALSSAIARTASVYKPEQVMIYRTTDFKSNEYRQLIGGEYYEHDEPNPMLGFRGEGRMIDKEYAELFKWELEAFKSARAKGFKNIALMLPVVRTPGELKRALDFLAENGIKRGDNGLKIGIMIEVPSNIFMQYELRKKDGKVTTVNRFLYDANGQKQVDFMSIGSNDLTQFTLAIGRDNEFLSQLGYFNENDPALRKALEIVIKVSKRLGVWTGLCGQRPTNDPEFAKLLVSFGIDSMGVAAGRYKEVVENVEKAEKSANPQISGNPFFVVDEKAEPVPLTAKVIKANDILKEKIGIHPRILLAYDRGEIMDAKLREEIRQKIVSTMGREMGGETFYKEMLYRTLKENIIQGLPFIYGTSDLYASEYRKLLGGDAKILINGEVKNVELDDPNPAVGFAGLARMTSVDYRDILKWEMEVIGWLKDEGYNMGVEFNLVRKQTEIETALQIMRSLGLSPGESNGVTVGISVDNVASLLMLDDFIRVGKLSFASYDKEQLLQYEMAADPLSPKQLVTSEDKEVEWQILLGILKTELFNLKVKLLSPLP
ncbi:MAG: PEP/pyruvate-binding domain-containing protein [Candidatus Omnitrophota bacterium]